MEKSGDLCGDLSGPASICGDLQGSVWLHTLRHSAIWLWGPASSPALQPFSVPKRPGRTAGPCGTAVKSVPGRVSKDARAKRPNLSKTAVLGVGGRALQSLVKWVLPVVICRARPSSAGPGRHL